MGLITHEVVCSSSRNLLASVSEWIRYCFSYVRPLFTFYISGRRDRDHLRILHKQMALPRFVGAPMVAGADTR